MSFVVHLAKESFKFSSTHFTIFSATKAEKLHGHNYQVKCDIEFDQIDSKIGMAFDFNLIKPEIKSLCDEIDEHILIATKSPFLKVTRSADSIEMTYNERRYVFPKDDCRELELVNITSEELARYFCEKLWTRLLNKKESLQFKSLQITIEETRGQSVTFKKSH
jgi:6-pyruvoyltetrahydropterin/6-carboxytetrahydropterin synthase